LTEEQRKSKSKTEGTGEFAHSVTALKALGALGAAGLLVALVPAAAHASNVQSFLGLLGGTLFVAGASAMIGGSFGFLFGLPRTLQPQRSVAALDRTEILANTNLEQISDWLTKILVGIGLTQITTIPDRLQNLAAYLTQGLTANDPGEQPLALTILVYFLLCGFLFGFLWTRLSLRHEMELAEGQLRKLRNDLKEDVRAEAAQQVRPVADRVKKVEEQQRRDAETLKMVEELLDITESDTDAVERINQDQLNIRIGQASASARQQIFTIARDQRREASRTDPDNAPELIARTVPVFMALCNADREGNFHRYRGQLGYALKEKQPPDYEGAMQTLADAIRIRDQLGERGWPLYELNRAISGLHLVSLARQRGNEVPGELAAQIDSDLNTAMMNPKLTKRADDTTGRDAADNKMIKDWREQSARAAES
jgi:hypothetical protein